MFIGIHIWLSAIASLFFLVSCVLCVSQSVGFKDKPNPQTRDPLTYIWPLPAEFTHGDQTVSVNPGLSLALVGKGGHSTVVRAAVNRYRGIIFKHIDGHRFGHFRKIREIVYDINKLEINVHSNSEEVGYLYSFANDDDGF